MLFFARGASKTIHVRAVQPRIQVDSVTATHVLTGIRVMCSAFSIFSIGYRFCRYQQAHITSSSTGAPRGPHEHSWQEAVNSSVISSALHRQGRSRLPRHGSRGQCMDNTVVLIPGGHPGGHAAAIILTSHAQPTNVACQKRQTPCCSSTPLYIALTYTSQFIRRRVLPMKFCPSRYCQQCKPSPRWPPKLDRISC